MKTPAPKKSGTSAVDKRNSNTANFSGTDNPRELRAIHAGMTRPMPREHLDRVIGCSNSPDVIFRLRAKGLEYPCVKVPDTDRDGLPIMRGVYHLTEQDRRKVSAWKSKRQAGAIDATLAALIALGAVCTVLLMGAL